MSNLNRVHLRLIFFSELPPEFRHFRVAAMVALAQGQPLRVNQQSLCVQRQPFMVQGQPFVVQGQPFMVQGQP